MLDYHLEKIYNLEKINLDQDITLKKNNIKAVRDFNPYETLNDNLPPTFYEILSLYNNFKTITCTKRRTNSYFRALDLDTSYGFTMATQGKYLKSFIVGMSRVYEDIDKSSFDMGRLQIQNESYEGLESSCNEDGGCDVVFCSEIGEEENIRRFKLCVDLAASMGTVFYRTFDPDSYNTRSLVIKYSKFFSKVSLYKPATTSCVSKECYVVLQNRLVGEGVIRYDEVGYDKVSYNKQVETLEYYRRISIDQINKGIKNKVSVSLAMTEYLGL